MLVDTEKILQIADYNPGKLKPVLVLKQERSRDPDTVYDWINPDHAIHIGIALQCEIIFYGMIKTISKIYDRKPKDKFDRWPSITLQEFLDATSDWVRRSKYIGNDLAYWLETLKKHGYLRICKHDGVVFMAFSREAVFLILRTVGLNTNMKFISY